MSSGTIEGESGRVWCFQCGNDYDEDVATCTECGVPTTGEQPRDASKVGSEDDDQLAYELHEWTGAGRSTLDGMLSRSNIEHAWQGATLIVRESDEDAVDLAVAETEVVAMPTLDLNEPTMVYELEELDKQQYGRLLRRLTDASISHAFDREGDLFAYESDEASVDELFEGLEEPDPVEREFGPGVAGVDPVEAMSDLFVAAGRLRKRPGDARGVGAFVESASIVERMTLPYGLTHDVWADVVDRSNELSDAVSGGTDLEEGAVTEMAEALHDLLRSMV